MPDDAFVNMTVHRLVRAAISQEMQSYVHCQKRFNSLHIAGVGCVRCSADLDEAGCDEMLRIEGGLLFFDLDF